MKNTEKKNRRVSATRAVLCLILKKEKRQKNCEEREISDSSFVHSLHVCFNTIPRHIIYCSPKLQSSEGKRWNEFAAWHVASPAGWHNYAGCNICRMTQS